MEILELMAKKGNQKREIVRRDLNFRKVPLKKNRIILLGSTTFKFKTRLTPLGGINLSLKEI